MVLHGEADVILPDLKGGKQRQRLKKGDCVYYPAQFAHTIEGVSSEPVNYLMLKWLADPSGVKEPLGFQRFGGVSSAVAGRVRQVRLLSW